MGGSSLLLTTEAICEVKIHPLVIFQILDRFLRRSEEQDRVIGTLLGQVENGIAEVTNSFAVPHLENGDEVAVGKDFHTQMYELHQRVNENEVLIGWYATTVEGSITLVDEHSGLMHEFYGSVCEMPIHLVVDTNLHQDDLQISAFISTPLEIVESATTNQFKQIPVTQLIDEPTAIALSSMVNTNENEEEDKKSSSIMLPNELEALESSISRLHTCLSNAEEFVDEVVKGKLPADPRIGREISDALATIPMLRTDQFEAIFNSGVQDLLMVSYLSGLTQAQLSMAEKLLSK